MVAVASDMNGALNARYGEGEWRVRLWEEDRETIFTSSGADTRVSAGAALYVRGRLMGEVVCDARDEDGVARGLMSYAKREARRDLIARAVAGEYAYEEALARGAWLGMLRARPEETKLQMLAMAAIILAGCALAIWGAAAIIWTLFWYALGIDLGWAAWIIQVTDVIKSS